MSIPGSVNPLFLGAAGQAGESGYQIERSVRFNSPDSAYLSRTPGSAGNRKTWTWAGWVKRSVLTVRQAFFAGHTGGAGNYNTIEFLNDNLVFLYGGVGGGPTTTAVFRDASAWMHVCVALDTTQATSSNRVKIYVNGIQQTIATGTYPTQNADLQINAASQHDIGMDGGFDYFSGFLADIHFIDSQALTPSAFGEFDTNGVWQPIEYTGTFGTNGFHLPFSDNSTAAALGTDTSSNGNTWTVNNIAVGGAQPALYSSPNLYTNAADVIANGTPLSSGSTFSNVYVYLVTNGGGDVGSKVFTADGSGTIGYNTNWTWLHRIGASWTSSGGYNDTEWDLFTWGSQTVATNYIMNNSAPLHMLVSSAGSPQQVSGTIATFNSTPNSGTGNDSLVDSPTNGSQTDTGAGGEVVGNYCTINPLQSVPAAVLSNGNLDGRVNSYYPQTMIGSIFQSTGKWYAECTVTLSSDGLGHIIGIVGPDFKVAALEYVGNNAASYSYKYDGQKFNNASGVSYGSSYGLNDVIGIAMDLDGGTLTFYKNGVSQGQAYSGLTGLKAFAASLGGDSPAYECVWNFGQRQWAYAAPAGFKALTTANLPTPLIEDGSTVMDVALYTGNGSTQTISGLNFSPDLVWLKSRSQNSSHCLLDTVRGRAGTLNSDNTAAEYTASPADRDLVSFDSTGFTLGQNYNNVTNTSPSTYVAWCWDAGSSTVTNTEGSITSQVRANASSGFSVVTYTGSGANATVGHGLGVAPSMYIVKNRTGTSGFSDWYVYHAALGAGAYLFLNQTAAEQSSTGVWNNTSPTSTVFSLGAGSGGNYSAANHVAYCFAPVAGYSAFGSYTGNGSTYNPPSPFVYLGFRPAVVMVKMSSSTGNWTILDDKREGYNVDNDPLFPNLFNAEGTTDLIDITSNGFKVRTTDATFNTNAGTYIYAAFAEHPFQSSRAR